MPNAEFERVLIHVENHSVYESAKILRDKYVLTLDNGEQVYLDFFSSNTDRNMSIICWTRSRSFTMNWVIMTRP